MLYIVTLLSIAVSVTGETIVRHIPNEKHKKPRNGEFRGVSRNGCFLTSGRSIILKNPIFIALMAISGKVPARIWQGSGQILHLLRRLWGRNEKWHAYDPLPPTPDFGAVLQEIKADPTGIFWG